MVSIKKLELCAENIAKCVNIKDNDCVYIRGNSCYQNIAEEVALNVLRYKGHPFMNLMSDNYYDIIFKDERIKAETLERTPKHILKLTENIDIRITFDFYKDPSIRVNVPKEKSQALLKAYKPLNAVVLGNEEKYAPGKRFLYVGWPTREAAEFFNINYELFEKFLVGGISISHEKLNQITKNLKKQFLNVEKIHIQDDFGTDFWVNVKGRKCCRDYGLITDHNIKKGILGSNLPAGEIAFAPYEERGEGTLFCPLTRDPRTRKIIKNLELKFKNGKLLINHLSADNNVEDIISTFNFYEQMDKMSNFPTQRTINIAELGIGCNPNITKSIGYILTDEKIAGTIHLALGSNEHFGGTSKSTLHWDFVSKPNANITVECIDGSKKKVMENGVWIEDNE